MTQHLPLACNESNGTWLPLIEYSVRSGLSLSTIRRRIKSNSLQYRLEQGRYLIFFEGPQKASPSPVLRSAPETMPVSEPVSWAEPMVRRENSVHPEPVRTPPPAIKATVPAKDEVDNAVRMISEAFEHALREKDERIHLLEKENLALEERLNELRLLVKVLEEKYEVRY